MNACAQEDRGIWKVTPVGQQSLVATLPPEARANGIAYHDGLLYVADSASGGSGGSTVTVRAQRRSGLLTCCCSIRLVHRQAYLRRMAYRSSVTRSMSRSRPADILWPSLSARMGRLAQAACT